MSNFWKKISRPILVLAPMAGYTQSPFRQLIRQTEASTILVSELVSVEALIRGNEKTNRLIAFAPEEKNYYGIQIFGSDIESFKKSAKIIEDLGADFIDINFGCPSPKVIGSGYGSALLKTPHLACKLIESLVQSTRLPITAKMRLGFYDDEDLIQTTKDFELAGLSVLAIHGRTTKQKFTGKAAWEKIYEVKEHLKIPVIGNGDISSPKIAVQRIKNLDGVMIGRGALKNPWIFFQTRQLLETGKVPLKPTLTEQVQFFREYLSLAIKNNGMHYGILESRKFFVHFLKGFPGASQIRNRIVQVETMEEIEKLFEELELQE